MHRKTPTSRVTFTRSLKLALLVLVGVFSLLASNLHTPPKAHAVTSNFLNFQARLEAASGAIAPDGNYNVEFNIYGGTTCAPSTGVGCSVLWTEDYLNSATQGIHTTNGYVTANLGSITAFPATINWDQQLYISMTVRGTGSCAFAACTPADAAMLPYLQLTSVPYAFKAGQLAQANAGATIFSSLSIQAPTVGNQNFVIQDQGVAGTYNLLSMNQSNGIVGLGVASSLTGSLKFYNSAAAGSVTISIANPGTNNFTLSVPALTGNDTLCTVTTGCGGSGANVTLSNLTGPTAINTDLTFANGGNRALTISATGAGVAGRNLSVSAGNSGTGAVNGGDLVLQGGATGGTGTTGSVVVKANGTDSATAFVVQSASSLNVLSIDTSANVVTIGSATPDSIPVLLQLDKNFLDPTEVDGAMFYNTNTGNFRCGVGGVWENCVGGTIAASTTSSSPNNTCTAACVSFNNGRVAIPANYCNTGRVIYIKAAGVYSTAALTTPTLGFEVRYGTDATVKTNDVLIGVASPLLASGSGVTNLGWNMDFTIICQSNVAMMGEGNASFALTPTTSSNIKMSTSVFSSVVTNSAKNLYIFPTWGTSSASNTIAAQQIIITGG